MKLHKRGDGDAVETAPLEDNRPKSKKKSEQSVIVYVTILFTVAFLLVLLSYFMQQRKNEDTISDMTEEHTQITMQAQQNIEKLQNDNLTLQQKLASAQEENEKLEQKIEELSDAITELGDKLIEQNAANAEQAKKITALEAFMEFRAAYLTEDEEALAAMTGSMEENIKYLDDTYKTMCQEILDELNNTEVEEND